MDIRRVVGENVRRYRQIAGLSQEELAARIGVEQGYISRLEAGSRNPTILTIWHASQALKIKPAMLFDESRGQSKPRKKRKKHRKVLIQI
jgi:transcriptional regulator with XRE-family HTH domain